MAKWVTAQIDDDTHLKLRTAATHERMTLSAYIARVLTEHTEKMDVMILDREKEED